ncbi:MAG: GAF domain-containing protein [Ignavibacteriales bacterium]|jgi:L-methionine (R)-S-oxide reductase|nr:GAF domain-containing protein [Ignavibacteriales bacterium]
MSNELTPELLTVQSKEERYTLLLEQMPHLIQKDDHWLSSLSNFVAVLNQVLSDASWVGFYLVDNNKLVLGPFQGKLACTQIQFGKGVCGKVAETLITEIVPNVHKFPGHIACDSESNSEIVVPVIKDSVLIGVLDLDSTLFNTFDEIDKIYLEQLVDILITNSTIPFPLK